MLLFSSLKSEQKGNHPPGGWGLLFGLCVSRPEPGVSPMFLLCARGRQLSATTCHLRWGQLPSAGPRQEKGAESTCGGSLDAAGLGLRFPTFSAMRPRKRWGTHFSVARKGRASGRCCPRAILLMVRRTAWTGRSTLQPTGRSALPLGGIPQYSSLTDST